MVTLEVHVFHHSEHINTKSNIKTTQQYQTAKVVPMFEAVFIVQYIEKVSVHI